MAAGEGAQEIRNQAAALIRSSGPSAGARYPVSGDVTRVGRGPGNDVVIQGPDAAVVSVSHAEIRREGRVYRIFDCGSTNGTYVDGERVTEAVLDAYTTIQLGTGGPELAFVFDEVVVPDLNRTLEVPPDGKGAGAALAREHEPLVREAVVRTRIAHNAGVGDQTTEIVRDVLGKALHRSHRRFWLVIASLVAGLAVVTVYGWARVHELNQAKALIDARIVGLERRLAVVQNPAEADALIASLDTYQNQAEALQGSMFFRWRVGQDKGTVLHEIRSLMSEFGAEVYSVPPDFEDQVNQFLKRYQGPDRPNMARALDAASPVMGRVRRILREDSLPEDLAYMVLVESAMDGNDRSRAGCLGLWQFTPATATGYGLRVGGAADERLDVSKSTRAAARYIRELILDFGAGSSVMLALAAYNVGPAKVKQAIHTRVEDPIKQRSFWYLYRIRALPEETRQYVPKVIAAMIIGRHPSRYGF